MLLDIRENGLRFLLPTHESKQLLVGDVWLGLSGEHIAKGGVCVERKEVKDLEASLRDGRYREQRTRLLSYCQEHGARPLYIIEGDLDSLAVHTPKKTLWKVLLRLALRYNIALFQTETLTDTAKLLETIEEQLTADPTCFIAPEGGIPYTELLSSSRKVNRDGHLGSAMLQQCSGISDKTADALLKSFGSFQAIIAASEEVLAQTKISEKRKLGPAIAKKLHAVFYDCPPPESSS